MASWLQSRICFKGSSNFFNTEQHEPGGGLWGEGDGDGLLFGFTSGSGSLSLDTEI